MVKLTNPTEREILEALVKLNRCHQWEPVATRIWESVTTFKIGRLHYMPSERYTTVISWFWDERGNVPVISVFIDI